MCYRKLCQRRGLNASQSDHRKMKTQSSYLKLAVRLSATNQHARIIPLYIFTVVNNYHYMYIVVSTTYKGAHKTNMCFPGEWPAITFLS